MNIIAKTILLLHEKKCIENAKTEDFKRKIDSIKSTNYNVVNLGSLNQILKEIFYPKEENIVYTDPSFLENTILERLQVLEKRVKTLDKIEAEVARFYPNEDEQHNEVVGDLGDIGEITARILGYL